MSPIGKIRISVFLLGILICLFVASVNGQQADGNGNEDDGRGRKGPGGPGRGGPGRRGPGRRGQGGQGGPGGPGYNKDRKFKKSGKFSDFFEQSTDVPDFCQEKACPKFTVESQTEDYELRNYDETNWLAMNISGRPWRRFRLLLNYLNGSNTEKRKIKIGVPVLKEYVGDNTQPERMLFYTSETNLPEPDSDFIKRVKIPSGLRYVKVFGGFATNTVVVANKKQLVGKISGGYDAGSYYAAIFNAPFQKEDRHNELSVLATQAP